LYGFGRGRLDETINPFATRITPNDVRITTKYEEEPYTRWGMDFTI
jgi:carboxypeptidase Taq